MTSWQQVEQALEELYEEETDPEAQEYLEYCMDDYKAAKFAHYLDKGE